MAVRKIVKIIEEKCNGCGLCIPNCLEGAIEIRSGKAKIIEDKLCDGMGNCLGHCPQDAIEIIEREADDFDEEAVKQKAVETVKVSQKPVMHFGCPGSNARKIERAVPVKSEAPAASVPTVGLQSELNQWPVQISLINPHAAFFEGADVLIAADCTAYAYANFHRDFIKGRVTLIGCPKLDNVEAYAEKLSEIFRNNIKSITVVRMSVPCCGGIVAAAKKAILKSENIVPYREVIIDLNGEVIG